MPVSHDYLSDYRTLGCAPGCSLAELERAWRAALSQSHPDRASPGEQAEAAARTQALNTAYRRLRGFAQLHGRMPGQPTAAADTDVAPAPAAHSTHPSSAARPGKGRARRRLALAAIVAALGVSWALHEPSPSHSIRADAAAARGTIKRIAVARFELHSHADEVLELAGEPVLRQGDELRGETWEYGPSFVVFRARRVVDWYSSPMRPLPVASERPPAQDTTALTAPPYRK